MSSKKRRAARAWMQETLETNELVLASLRLRHIQTTREAVEAVRAELTRAIPRAELGRDTHFYPQGKPEHSRLMVAARWDGVPELVEYRDPNAYRRFLGRVHTSFFALNVEQHALVLPDGTTVIWFGWKLA